MTRACSRGYPSADRQRALVAALTIALCVVAGPVRAQRLSVALDGAVAAGAGPRVSSTATPAAAATVTVGLEALRVGDAEVDAWARLGLAAAGARAAAGRGLAPAVGVGTAWRRVTTFGPLGNVILEGGGSFRLAPEPALPLARAWFGARGTLGAVALSLAAEAGNVAPGALDPGRPPPPDPRRQASLRELDALRARFALPSAAWDAGGRLGLTYRVDRDVSLSIDASARRLDGAPYLAAQVALRRARIEVDLDGSLAVQAETFRGAAAFAVGFGAFHAPRRGPASLGRVWLGAGPGGVRPGVEALWAQRTSVGELRVRADWRPWLGPEAWQAEASFEHATSVGALRWTLGARGAAGTVSPPWRLGVALTRPLAQP